MKAFVIKLLIGLLIVGGATYAAYYYTQESHSTHNEKIAKKVRAIVDKDGYVDNTISVTDLRQDIDNVSEDVLRGELESRLPDIEDRQKANKMTNRLIKQGVVTNSATQAKIQSAINAMDIFPDSTWKEERLMSLASASKQLSDTYNLRTDMTKWLAKDKKHAKLSQSKFEDFQKRLENITNTKSHDQLQALLQQLEEKIKK